MVVSADQARALARRALASLTGLAPSEGAAPLPEDGLGEEPALEALEPGAMSAAERARGGARREGGRQERGRGVGGAGADGGRERDGAPDERDGLHGQVASASAMISASWTIDPSSYFAAKAESAARAAADVREKRAEQVARDTLHSSWQAVRADVARARAARAEAEANDRAVEAGAGALPGGRGDAARRAAGGARLAEQRGGAHRGVRGPGLRAGGGAHRQREASMTTAATEVAGREAARAGRAKATKNPALRWRAMIRVGLRMMVHDKLKMLGTLVGVVFAVLLSNQQAGTFLGLIQKNTMFIDNAGADMWIVPPNTAGAPGGEDDPGGDLQAGARGRPASRGPSRCSSARRRSRSRAARRRP